MAWEQIALRLGVALLLGSAIGLERQWRSHYVGLRTNALITIGSAALMLFAFLLPPGDITALGRIASQIITGVGFLCAGVIMHEGVNVKGFNTAATLWCSTVVGMLVGTGLFLPAMMLTLLILLVNLFLLPVVNLINTKTTALEESDSDYIIIVTCHKADEMQARSAIIACIETYTRNLKGLITKRLGEVDTVQINAEIALSSRNNALVEKIMQDIGKIANVTVVQWQLY